MVGENWQWMGEMFAEKLSWKLRENFCWFIDILLRNNEFSHRFLAILSWHFMSLKNIKPQFGICIYEMPHNGNNKIANWNVKRLNSASLRAERLEKCKFLHFNVISTS